MKRQCHRATPWATGKPSNDPGFMAELGQPIGFVADIVAAVGRQPGIVKYLKERGRLCGSITLAIEREIVMHDLISRDKGT